MSSLRDKILHSVPSLSKNTGVKALCFSYTPFASMFFAFICFAFTEYSMLSYVLFGISCGLFLIILRGLLKHFKRISPENLLKVPAFIIAETGKIIRSNKPAKEFNVKNHTQLQDVLTFDGFDDGASYRILNSPRGTIIRSGNILYSARFLESEKNFLVYRYFHESKVENQTPSEEEKHLNQLKTIKENISHWLETDYNLNEYLQEFGSRLSQRYLKKDTLFEVNFIDKDNNMDIQFHIVFSDPNNSDRSKDKTLIIPASLQNQNKETNIKKLEKPAKTPEKIGNHGFFNQIFLNAPSAILVVNQEGNILNYNNSFSILIDRQESATNIYDYFEEKDHAIISKAPQDRKTHELTFHIGDQKKIIKLYANELLVQASDVCYVYYITDHSEEKDLENKMNQAQKMQAVGQLAGGIAHDFNNLLTSILGNTELLLLKTSHKESHYNDLVHIEQSAHRAGKLVKQLLAFSRQQTLQPKIIQVTDILPDINDLLRRLLGENITLETYYGAHLKAIKIDITQLEQVILNLAVNAKDAMKGSGSFKIQVKNISPEESLQEGYDILPSASYVALYVSDSGCGMTVETRKKIFEPFFTTKAVGQGTGLGLATVYGIVKQSHGFIFVESEIDQGTTFKIYLPAFDTEESSQDISVKPQQPQESDLKETKTIQAHTKTILLAEDEASVREFIVRVLKMRGYQVLVSDCGEEALKLFEEHQEEIDLILSDVIMPGMDGPSWVKKALSIREDIQVIFMSGYAEDSYRDDPSLSREGLKADFLAKPFSLKVLTDTIKNAL